MNIEENNEPRRVKFNRIVPQIKTFKVGTLLKNKIDLYYSTEENIVETGGEDNFNPLVNMNGNSAHVSFSESGDFIHKESISFFVEAAQFRADDNNIYIRLQLLSEEKVVWINLLKIQNRVWSFMIRSEQKKLIEEEMKKMFDTLQEGNLEKCKR